MHIHYGIAEGDYIALNNNAYDSNPIFSVEYSDNDAFAFNLSKIEHNISDTIFYNISLKKKLRPELYKLFMSQLKNNQKEFLLCSDFGDVHNAIRDEFFKAGIQLRTLNVAGRIWMDKKIIVFWNDGTYTMPSLYILKNICDKLNDYINNILHVETNIYDYNLFIKDPDSCYTKIYNSYTKIYIMSLNEYFERNNKNYLDDVHRETETNKSIWHNNDKWYRMWMNESIFDGTINKNIIHGECTPDYIGDYSGAHMKHSLSWRDEDAIAFGFYKVTGLSKADWGNGKLSDCFNYLKQHMDYDDFRQIEDDVKNNNPVLFMCSDTHKRIKEMLSDYGIWVAPYRFAGRLWTEDKVMTFWNVPNKMSARFEFPSGTELDEILKKLDNVLHIKYNIKPDWNEYYLFKGNDPDNQHFRAFDLKKYIFSDNVRKKDDYLEKLRKEVETDKSVWHNNDKMYSMFWEKKINKIGKLINESVEKTLKKYLK